MKKRANGVRVCKRSVGYRGVRRESELGNLDGIITKIALQGPHLDGKNIGHKFGDRCKLEKLPKDRKAEPASRGLKAQP